MQDTFTNMIPGGSKTLRNAACPIERLRAQLRRAWRKRRLLADHLRSASIRFVVALPLALLLIWFNPFGAFDALNSLSRSVALRALSTHMPDRPIPVAVVLIDDDWLRSRAMRGLPASWPLSSANWAGIVARIARAQPRALALDFALLDDRPDDGGALLTATLINTGGQMPVLLAAGSAEAGALTPVSRAVQPAVLPAGPVRLVSVVVHGDPATLHPYSYQGDVAGRPNMVSALVAAVAPRHLPDRAELLWPSPPRAECDLHPPAFRQDLSSGCRGTPGNWLSSLLTTTLAGALDAVCDGRRARPPCALVPPVYYDANPVPTIAMSALEDPRLSERLDRLLHSAVVFVGQDFAFNQDRAYSPVYGSVPGVMTHAVAFENAVAVPDGGLADFQTVQTKLPVQVATVSAFLVVLIALALLGGHRRIKGTAIARVVETVALATACVVAAYVTSAILHYGPGNWLGISAACASALGIAKLLMTSQTRRTQLGAHGGAR